MTTMAEPAKKPESPAAAPVTPIQVNVQMPEPKVKVEPEVKCHGVVGGRFGMMVLDPATKKRTKLIYVNAEGQQIA